MAHMRCTISTSQRLLFVLVFLCAPLFTQAQVTQSHRFEKPQKNADDYFTIIPLHIEGLALYRQRDKYKSGNKIWELILLDTTLTERKTTELEIKDRYRFIGYEAIPGSLYLLYRTGETSKNDFELIEINLNTGEEVSRHQIKPDIDFKVTHFIKISNNLVLGGYVNNEAAIIMYDFITKNIRVIPGFFQKDVELVDLRTNQNQTFNTLVIDRSIRDQQKIILKTFDDQGKQLMEDVIPIEERKSIQNGITSTLQREDLIVIGTWGDRNAKQSSGFYTIKVDPFTDQKIKYLNFSKLNHYLDYLPAKRAARIKEKSIQEEAAGRTPSFTNQVMPFKLVEHENGFLLLAEVYLLSSGNTPGYGNPFFYNPYYGPYSYNPFFAPGFYYPGLSRMYRPFPNGTQQRNTEEIKMQQASIISFDATGNIDWDFSMKLDELKKSNLDQITDFYFTNDRVTFLYKKESELKIKSITLPEGTATEQTEKINTMEASDDIRSDRNYEDGLRQWFGNTFYTWGYQTIRNPSKEERVRDVFYINKLVVH